MSPLEPKSSVTVGLRQVTVGDILQDPQVAAAVAVWDRADPDPPARGQRKVVALADGCARRRVVVQCIGVHPTDLLRASAAAIRAGWVPSEQAELLIEYEGQAYWLARPAASFLQVVPFRLAPHLYCFTPRQMQTLRSGAALQQSDLLPGQRRALASLLVAVDARGSIVGPECFDSAAVRLVPSKSVHRGADPGTDRLRFAVEVKGLGRTGEFDTTFIGFEEEVLRDWTEDERRSLGAFPREVPTSRGRGVLEQTVTVDPEDGRLARPVVVQLGGVATLIQALVKQAHPNVVLPEAAFTRPAALAPGRYPAIQVLREVERVTGGRWGWVGEFLVLVPDETVDRMTWIEKYSRPLWRDPLAAEVGRSITTGQLRRLMEGETLTGRSLRKEQWTRLRRLCAMAVAWEPLVSGEALSPEKVALRYRKRDPARSEPEALEIHLPQVFGPPSRFVTAPLR